MSTAEDAPAQKRKRPANEISDCDPGLKGLTAQCDFLEAWFASHGADELYEIEVKLKAVDERQFLHIRSRLDSFPHWLRKSSVETHDYNHRSGTRKTTEGTSARYLIKTRIDDRDVTGDSGRHVRFSLSSEEECNAPDASDEVDVVRIKLRHSFNRKNEFLYELTEVRSGRTLAEARSSPATYEVELEWCGQAGADAFAEAFAAQVPAAGRPASAAAALAEKLLMKVQDLVEMANSTPAPS